MAGKFSNWCESLANCARVYTALAVGLGLAAQGPLALLRLGAPVVLGGAGP